MAELEKTPLYPVYERYGGKIIDFAGWALPVQFEGIMAEHAAVRQHAGLFDVSHMGEMHVFGEDALLFLQTLVSSDISRLRDYQVGYGMMLNENGGVVDDVLIYRFNGIDFIVVVNAANRKKDYEWMVSHSSGFNVSVEDVSEGFAQLAIQGPSAEEILGRLAEIKSIRFFSFRDQVEIGGRHCLVSRTGYTGEDGFELYVKPDDSVYLWDLLLDTGRDLGLKPVGLGCRDTLRFEACLPLYGHELADDISPLEAGLSSFVSMNKSFFIGKRALENQLKNGIPRKLAGFEMKDKGIPRAGYDIFCNGSRAGHVTTGYFSPTLEKNIGLGLIDGSYVTAGGEIEVMIRGKANRAVIREIPFYKKNYKR